MRLSSPASNNSRTITATNQLTVDEQLREGRQVGKARQVGAISGSSSTLTVRRVTAPAAINACTARLEKPHIGTGCPS